MDKPKVKKSVPLSKELRSRGGEVGHSIGDYSEDMGRRVFEYMRLNEVLTFRELSKREGMTSMIELSHWYRKEEKFRELVDAMDALQARLAFEDYVSVSDGVRDIDDKLELDATKVYLESKRVIMEKADPKKYTKQSSSEGSHSATINIVMPMNTSEDNSKRLDEIEAKVIQTKEAPHQ